MTRRLRLTVVSPFGDLGGGELWLLRMLENTDRLDVDVILLRDGPLRAELESRRARVRVHPVGRRARDLVSAGWWLSRELRRTAPDVVLANGIKAGTVACPAATLTGVPNVWVKHDHNYDALLTPLIGRLATRVVTATAEFSPPVRRVDTVVIEPPRPDDPPYPAEQARRQLNRLGVNGQGRLRLAMLTRLVAYKGVDTAIRALAEEPAQAWDLVVFGGEDWSEPDERTRLERLVVSVGVSGRVHLVGHVPAAWRLLPGCDALAMLTRPSGRRAPPREGFGTAAMEAMIAGIPVISPDDGGAVAARIADGAGLLLKDPDHRMLAQALGSLSDETTRRALAAESHRRSARFGDAPQASARLVAVLARAANRPGAGRERREPVTVVSSVLNERPDIDQLVRSLQAQTRSGDDIVVVDASSTDGTRERLSWWADQDPRVRVVDVPGASSLSVSRNTGIRAARHDLIACTDAGVVPDNGWLEGLRAARAEDDPPDLVVGTYRAAARPGRLFEAAFAAIAWPDPEELRRATPFRRAWTRLFGLRFYPDRLDGRSMCFTRQAWRRVDGFRPELFNAEDEAFGRAVLAAGGRSDLTLDAVVTWFQQETPGETFRQFRGYGRGGGASGSRHLLRRDVVRALAYLAVTAVGVRGSVRGRLLAALATAGWVSFPAARIHRRRHPLAALALVPAAQVIKDAGKMVGSFEAVVLGRRDRLPRRGDPSGPPDRRREPTAG